MLDQLFTFQSCHDGPACAGLPLPARHCKWPKLEVSLLSPSPSPRPLLDLLGFTDQELQEQMAKGHPYEFIMGHGKTISFRDFKEARIALMERNMSHVL